MSKITQSDKVNIINAYTNELVPMVKLAEQYHVTRQAIYKVLKGANVDTKKKPIQVSCTVCGAILSRNKARIRKQKNHFCDYECYNAFLNAGNTVYIPNRQGQRIARKVVSEYFNLKPEYIVHHEDKNNLNNLIYNLRVFACQGDHIRYHRGFEVLPIFDGSKIHS